ncbi:MAG: hypothetical protein ACOYON_09025 [Fimbriimonas sp.]
MTRIFAAADIGSNTAHLLVAATDGELVMRLDNLNEWIPLGEMVARVGEIPDEMIEQLILAMREFRRVATAKKAVSLYVFATEAMRQATNHELVLERIREEAQVNVEIISPTREAELSLRGVLLDTNHLGIGILFEVGGGSAQIGRVLHGQLVEKQSLPIGTGRLIAQAGLRNPCPASAIQAAEQYVERMLDRVEIHVDRGNAVASGGVGRGLWRALHPDSEKTISIEELDYLAWSTARLPLDRIVSRFGVKTKRAGTLLPGAIIYRSLMRRFGLKEIAVSEFGVREGAILEMATTRVATSPL